MRRASDRPSQFGKRTRPTRRIVDYPASRDAAVARQSRVHDPTPIRVLIVDDERLGRERLVALLEREPGIEIAGQCANGVEALRSITEGPVTRRPDLVLLDVQMPDLDGIEVAEALLGMAPHVEPPELLFVTAFSEYMERAFELHAVDYLRKPYSDARFASALAHARRRIAHRRAAGHLVVPPSEADAPDAALAQADVRHLVAALRQERPRRRIALYDRGRGTFTFIDAREVALVEADGTGHVVLRGRVGAERWDVGIETAEQQLAPLGFVRVHRSYLVHPDHLVEVKTLTRGQYMLTLPGGTRIDTGRGFARNMERLLADIPGAH